MKKLLRVIEDSMGTISLFLSVVVLYLAVSLSAYELLKHPEQYVGVNPSSMVVWAGLVLVPSAVIAFHRPKTTHANFGLIFTYLTGIMIMRATGQVREVLGLGYMGLTIPVVLAYRPWRKSFLLFLGYIIIVFSSTVRYIVTLDFREIFYLFPFTFLIWVVVAMYLRHAEERAKVEEEMKETVTGSAWRRLGKTLCVMWIIGGVALLLALLSLGQWAPYHFGWYEFALVGGYFVVCSFNLKWYVVTTIRHESVGLDRSYTG